MFILISYLGQVLLKSIKSFAVYTSL